MISELKHLPINWKNGMMFSQHHLSDQYIAVADAIRDVTELHMNHCNYGILGGTNGKTFAESFKAPTTSDQITLSFCRAVSRNGSRVEILNQDWPELNRTLSSLSEDKELEKSAYWYVVLVIDVFMRVPEGLEDEKESPRRKPYTRPAYGLELMSEEELQRDTLANAFPIAKFENTASGLRVQSDYIPPCTCVNSYEKLMQLYAKFERYLLDLQDLSEKIQTKVISKRRNRENNDLSEDIGAICRSYTRFFVGHYDEYRFLLAEQSPITLLVFFAKLARNIQLALNDSQDKGHVLQYFSQYATTMTSSEVEGTVRGVLEARYEHTDILSSLQSVNHFLSTLQEIFQRLEKLDYRELAPRNVIKEDSFRQPHRNDSGARSRSGIQIKRTGNSGNLGDDLS